MKEPTYEKQRIILEIDEKGQIVSATDHKGKGLTYAPKEEKRMDGGDTKLRSPNQCCWRYIPGVGWRCRPAYC